MTIEGIPQILTSHFQNTTKEERLKVFEDIETELAFKTLKTESKYLVDNGGMIQKDFTVGELKKYLNRIPDDYIVCKAIVNPEKMIYTSLEVLTVMQKQEYIDFKGDLEEANIITIY